MSSDDSLYTCDPEEHKALLEEQPWQKDPKYFKTAMFSPSAVMKINMHCQSGVEKGLKRGGKPVEVMGLLVGRPSSSPGKPRTLIIADAYPLPIEGFETRVVADDLATQNYMIALSESLEQNLPPDDDAANPPPPNPNKICGWYHSHPFDPSPIPHTYLSSTDLSTQLAYQRMEDPRGNPWLGVVVDPQRTLLTGKPSFGAFRAYPPTYQDPTPGRCPDGRVMKSDRERLEWWGSCWDRYYKLDCEYYMSALGRSILCTLGEDFTWVKGFGGRPAPAQLSEPITTDDAQAFEAAAGLQQASISTGIEADVVVQLTQRASILARKAIEKYADGEGNSETLCPSSSSSKEPSSHSSGPLSRGGPSSSTSSSSSSSAPTSKPAPPLSRRPCSNTTGAILSLDPLGRAIGQQPTDIGQRRHAAAAALAEKAGEQVDREREKREVKAALFGNF